MKAAYQSTDGACSATDGLRTSLGRPPRRGQRRVGARFATPGGCGGTSPGKAPPTRRRHPRRAAWPPRVLYPSPPRGRRRGRVRPQRIWHLAHAVLRGLAQGLRACGPYACEPTAHGEPRPERTRRQPLPGLHLAVGETWQTSGLRRSAPRLDSASCADAVGRVFLLVFRFSPIASLPPSVNRELAARQGVRPPLAQRVDPHGHRGGQRERSGRRLAVVP